MLNLQHFKKKESQLQKAKAKCQAILELFKTGERKDVDNWNLVHDLEDRIDERIGDNWSAFKDWHWDNFGFNTY